MRIWIQPKWRNKMLKLLQQYIKLNFQTWRFWRVQDRRYSLSGIQEKQTMRNHMEWSSISTKATSWTHSKGFVFKHIKTSYDLFFGLEFWNVNRMWKSSGKKKHKGSQCTDVTTRRGRLEGRENALRRWNRPEPPLKVQHQTLDSPIKSTWGPQLSCLSKITMCVLARWTLD